MATRDTLLAEVQAAVAQETGAPCTKKDADIAVNAVLNSISSVVMAETGGSLRTSIGTFTNKAKAARTARNPQNGQTVEVPAKQQLSFKASASSTVVEGAKKAPAAKTVVKSAPVAKPAAKKAVVLKKK